MLPPWNPAARRLALLLSAAGITTPLDARQRWDAPRVLGPPPDTCQWIDGQPGPDDACKCARPVVPGQSWCAAHLAHAYDPPTPEHCIWQLVFDPHPAICAALGFPCPCCRWRARGAPAPPMP